MGVPVVTLPGRRFCSRHSHTSTPTAIAPVNATSSQRPICVSAVSSPSETPKFCTQVKLNTGNPALGSVRFTVDGKAAKSVTVSGGVAKFSYPAKLGRHTVRGVYLPRSATTVVGSTSNAVVVTITR